MKPEPSIRIENKPYACTDGSINPGSIIVQNYLTEHYLDRVQQILEKHSLKPILHFRQHYTDPDGDPDSLLIIMQDCSWRIDAALKEIREVSDNVEAADLILQKETDERLKAETERFEKSVEAFRKIMEG